MNSAARDITDYLDGLSAFAHTRGTDLYADRVPSKPDACVTVRLGPGLNPPTSLDNNQLFEPRVQLLVRGAKGKYTAAYAVADEIQTILHMLTNETINGTKYIFILALGDILDAGEDENERPQYTLNFRMLRTPAA